MRNRLTKLITTTIALAAVAFIGSSWAAGQTENQYNLKRIHVGIIGLVDGQTLRVSAHNPNPPDQSSEPVFAQVRLYDAEGESTLVYSGESGSMGSEEVDLRPGEFHSFNFDRADLRVPGEPGTGRLQVRAEIIYRHTDNPGQSPPENFVVSTEIVDPRTGETKVYQTGSVGWVKVSPDA